MATSTLQHRFTVSAVSFTEDVPSRINIKKRREYVGFHSTTDENNVNVMYLGGEDSSADKNLSISDRSTSLVQNRIPQVGDVTIATGSTFQISVDQFLVTDQFTEVTPTQPSIPLFYVHTLAGYNVGLAGFATSMTLVNIEFLDHNFEVVPFSEYILDPDTGYLYNNIENSYNSRTKAADITLVKYTVKLTTLGAPRLESYHELINNQPIYHLAEFTDIDSFGSLYVDSGAYLVTETATGFTVTMPTVGTYAYRESPDSRIKVLPPSSSNVVNPWFVRITNGRFLTSLPTSPSIYESYEYGIAEFNSQTFDPLPPYRSQSGEKADRISNRLMQVSKNIAHVPDNSLFVNVIVHDEFNDPKYAFTNDSSNVDLPYGSTTLSYEAGIASIDARNGIIEVTRDLGEDDVAYVTYYTEEKQFEFTSVDCNPTNNLAILNQRLVLYINPEKDIDLDQSLYYLVVDPVGRIQYCSQPDENSDGLDPATLKMLAEDFNTNGEPTHTLYYDTMSPTEALHSRVSGVNTTYIDDFSFIDKYTVESQLYNFTTYSGTLQQNFEENPKLLVLADISVGESERPGGFTDFDVRVRGGGIKEAHFNDALDEQSEIAWYWDQIQQRPYPATTACYVEVPNEIFDDHGGRFSRKAVVTAIERHMQLGGYPVVKPYGIDPTVWWYTATSGALAVAWPSYGNDYSYNVHYSNALDGVYEQVNDTALQNVHSGNLYAMSGLNPATSYYVKIEAVNEAEEWSYGPPVRITTASGLEEE